MLCHYLYIVIYIEIIEKILLKPIYLLKMKVNLYVELCRNAPVDSGESTLFVRGHISHMSDMVFWNILC